MAIVRLVINGTLTKQDDRFVLKPTDDGKPSGEFTLLKSVKVDWDFETSQLTNESLAWVLRLDRTFTGQSPEDSLAERLMFGEKAAQGNPYYVPGNLYLITADQTIKATLSFTHAYVSSVEVRDDEGDPTQHVVLMASGYSVDQGAGPTTPTSITNFAPNA